MFDIFLACAPKDYNKLPFVVESIIKNIEGYDKIFVCAPEMPPSEIQDKLPNDCSFHLDNNVLPGCDRSLWRFRPNWLFQQHLKLFQQVTQDWYLTLDCDTIINRPMKFFENVSPIYWKGWNQFHAPYFIHMAFMIGLPKIDRRSCIADMNFIYRPIVNNILERNEYTIESFIAKSQEVTTEFCHIGMPELYGNYCAKYYPDFYTERFLKQKVFNARKQHKINDLVWKEVEIKNIIEQAKKLDVDTLAIHSWLDEGDQ